MGTTIAVLFGMAFGAIIVLGIIKTQKPKTPTKTGGGNASGGGGSIETDNQEVKDNNDRFEQAQ